MSLSAKSQLSPAKQALLEKRLRGKKVKSQDSELPTIIPQPEAQNEPFPLTDIQQAYWIGRQGAFELGNVATHLYLEIDTFDLDLERFSHAWQQIIERHGMLRAIVQNNGEQRILDQVSAYQIKVWDLQEETPETAKNRLAEIRERLDHQIFAAEKWPLFEIQASLLNNQRVRLHFSFDILICDAWSLGIISRELAQLMENPKASLPRLELSFRDYVLAEIEFRKSETYRRSLNYWQNLLPSLPPSPELPLEKSLATIKQPRIMRRSGKLASTTWQKIKQQATKLGVTPTGLLLTAFTEILTLWSKNPRFTLTLTLFNTLPIHSQVNDLVGDFTSLTLLAVDNSEPDSFVERVKRIQKQFWDALDHRYVSGVHILRELARRQERNSGAIMPVVFTSTLMGDTSSRDSLPMSWLGDIVYSVSQTPQVYLDHQVYEDNNALIFYWDAVEELFPAGLLDDMFNAYSDFLERLANEEKIWQTKTRKLLPITQKKQIAAINCTDKPIPEKVLLHSGFFEQALLHPQQTAIVSSDRILTYRELRDRANYLATQLQQLGATPNQLIAILMEKGWEQIVAVLGILASGAAYLPIDPKLPTERQWYLLESGKVQWVLTQSHLDTLKLPENVQRLNLDTSEVSDSNITLKYVTQPTDLAYVIYTSGSTGKPKGVTIDHRGAVNTILDINQRFQLNSKDRIFALSSLSFDLSVYDIFGTLSAGGTIVIPDADGTKNPAHWLQLITENQVTVWNSVPQLMQMLVEYTTGSSTQLLPSLRLVMLSGDWLPLSLPEQVRALSPKVQLISLGGATEASIWSILYPIEKVDSTWKSIPYGRPMTNQHFYVLNEAMSPCPIWVPGQLYIGGIGLAKGYWDNPEKTNTSFIIHPQTQERLYKTGDLGRYLPNGNIEFLGREDFQVKINGHRIELGEIESTLKLHPLIREVVLTTVAETEESQQLVAYLVIKSNSNNLENLSANEWRNFLEQKLPEYMIPAHFIILETLPLTVNGKIDRRALPVPKNIRTPEKFAFVKPQTEIQQSIAAIWREILQLEEVGIHDNFFELGGNSLLLIKTQVRLQEIFAQELSVVEMIKSPTIDALAKFFTSGEARETAAKQGQNRAEYRESLKNLRQQRTNFRKKLKQN
ncbi:MAG: amino acid adenylation domain-containing protein [Kamptonema sp. SIO1D9]|nr:amino acid adenylation domain-containing protein [Kamptonema sp. SIO1D9]